MLRPSPPMTSSLPDLSGLTILVIEDDPDGLQLLTTALTACGARVMTASDTTIARGHLETVKLDLVVTDLGLPGETGAAFISWLRMHPRDKGGNLAAIAITGDPRDFPAVRVGGIPGFLEEALDLDDLCAMFTRLIRAPCDPAV